MIFLRLIGIFKRCLTILGHYALKGLGIFKYMMISAEK